MILKTTNKFKIEDYNKIGFKDIEIIQGCKKPRSSKFWDLQNF